MKRPLSLSKRARNRKLIATEPHVIEFMTAKESWGGCIVEYKDIVSFIPDSRLVSVLDGLDNEVGWMPIVEWAQTMH